MTTLTWINTDKMKEIGRTVRSMDTIARTVNDKSLLYDYWFAMGVADGDCICMDDVELGEEYEENLQELIGVFFRFMNMAGEDGLLIGDVVGTKDD